MKDLRPHSYYCSVHESLDLCKFQVFPLKSIFLKNYLFIFLERGERREKEKVRNINVWLPLAHPPPETWPTTQACALTGNRTSDPLVCRLALNPLSYTSQG